MRNRLLHRLDGIAQSLAAEPGGQALLALGSVGVQLGRLDDHSDLDVFAVVDDGTKQRYLDSLDSLERVHAIEYAHRNTVDGYKVMFADGVFGEFAVFEQAEVATSTFPPARVVWAADRFDSADAVVGTVGDRRRSTLRPSRSAALRSRCRPDSTRGRGRRARR